jgi:glycosyltransferase involved in cell wall biosynthesis
VALGLRYAPARLRRSLEHRWLRKLEILSGKQIDLVWLFENSRFFDMRFARERFKIYHQVDLNQNFHPELAAATADLSIAISEPIQRCLIHHTDRFLRLTHGCPEGTLDNHTAPEATKERFRKDTVHAVLTGNLDIKYLDINLLKKLVSAHPNVQFHFVGQYSAGKGIHAALDNVANAVFWGRQPSNTLPYFLQQADVLLVTYLTDQHLDQLANPHKILEYLASGRCVLATRTLEYEKHLGLIEMADSHEDFLKKFMRIVASPATWNTHKQAAKRKAFAADNTYTRQIDRISAAIEAQAGPLL